MNAQRGRGFWASSASCAACRFHRRRCSSDCPLAPYFPADQPTSFENVHRLYGTANVTKILNKLNDNGQKEEAMRSIKYESDMRQTDPVHGCYGLITHLDQRLQESMHELHNVLHLLELCRKNNEVTQDPSILPSGSYPVNINNEIPNDHIVSGSIHWDHDPGF